MADAPAKKPEPNKPGIKTTELWTSVLSIVSVHFIPNLPPMWQAIATAVVGAAYTIARGLAKR